LYVDRVSTCPAEKEASPGRGRILEVKAEGRGLEAEEQE